MRCMHKMVVSGLGRKKDSCIADLAALVPSTLEQQIVNICGHKPSHLFPGPKKHRLGEAKWDKAKRNL